MGERVTLRVELGFVGGLPPADRWEEVREVGIAWLRKARPDVEPSGEAFPSTSASGGEVLAFLFTCDAEDFFVAGRLMGKVRRELGLPANGVAILPA